jgi:hypothetical protein
MSYQERKKIRAIMDTLDPELILINDHIEHVRNALSDLLSKKRSIEKRLLKENQEYKSLDKECHHLFQKYREDYYKRGTVSMPLSKRKVVKEKLEKIPVEKTTETSEEEVCVVCSENKRNVVFFPCGHKALCSACAVRILDTKLPCPICREKIGDITRVFEN